MPFCCVLFVFACPLAAQDFLFASGFEQDEAPPECGASLYVESFDATDGSDWPAPWTAVGSVATADIQGGASRLRPTPSGYSLARMVAPVNTLNVEVRFTMRLENDTTQGVGFYIRQNGGYLDQSLPTGEGYAVFIEGTFRGMPGIGVWREVDGHEQQMAHSPNQPVVAGTNYRVRLRVHQVDTTSTFVQAKYWEAGTAEPAGWMAEFLDSTPSLQNVSGGIAIDSWSVLNAAPIDDHTFVDDIEIDELCNPVENAPAPVLVDNGFLFTEGPLWRDDHLLFTDIDANSIYRLEPPDTFSLLRSPSDRSNGLALTVDDQLLAAEQTTRRVSITDAAGLVSSFVDNFQGMAFNAPNDLAVASDNTVYFSDPSYGSPGPREIPFNGLFRRDPSGVLSAEWMGTPGVNEPNGVALSPDGTTLYMSDTQAGELLAFDIADALSMEPGALSNPRVIADGLTIPDGMCVDSQGNVFVATWAPSIEVFSPDGAWWGSIPVAESATNCAFAGSDQILYITAQTGVYRLMLE